MKSVPAWAKKHKVPGTELRLLGGKYRLYQITSKWNREKKRAQKVTVAFLGTITPEGELIKPKATQVQESITANLSVLEYGPHAVVEALGMDIREHLQRHFPTWWKELWVGAQLRFLYQAPLKNWSYLYERSYLSMDVALAKISPAQCSVFLRDVGRSRTSIVQLLNALAGTAKDEHILIDTTHVPCRSMQIDIAKKGYNSTLSFKPQINLLYLFNADTKMPVYYRMLPGNIREISAMRLCITESQLSNVILIGDKGFYSQDNVEALNEERLRYILPLRRNNRLVSYESLAHGDKRTLDGHFMFHNRPIWFVKLTTEVTLFLDEHLRLRESSDYLTRLEEKCEGYSKETYLNRQHQFGTLALYSNLTDQTPQQCYQHYKARGAIEQAFDSYKNLLDADTTYMHGSEQMEAWSFINFLALVLYYRTYHALLQAKLLSKLSVSDLMLRAREAKLVAIMNHWNQVEISSRTISLFSKLKIPITYNKKS
jgi:Transposase DDE domain